jgi:hypothetical protein
LKSASLRGGSFEKMTVGLEVSTPVEEGSRISTIRDELMRFKKLCAFQ